MKMSQKNSSYPPLIYNVFKPPRMTSYEVIRHFKRNLPKGFGKIGHFGTLDPFASGVQLIGVAGAQRLNDFIHEYLPKTYISVGKLGVETPTGDLTSEISQTDSSEYLNTVIKGFSKEFIEEFLNKKFLGIYMQSPHVYSAAKYEGKPLHQWAREGVEIKKEQVQREIYKIEVIKYNFPYLICRTTVSSGTYIRTLFSDMSNELGTIGTLVSLVRESIGHIDMKSSLLKRSWPKSDEAFPLEIGMKVDEALDFSKILFAPFEAKLFKNGVPLKLDRAETLIKRTLKAPYYWVYEGEKLISLGAFDGELLKPYINFSSS